MGIFNKKIKLTDFYPKNYVDIHSHLLPGIDDGAKNLDNAIELIKRMSSFGINNFRTSPHVLAEVWENSSDTINQKANLLRDELKTRGLNHVNITAAAEYMMDDNFSKLLEKNDILTLKDNYVLVEMSFFNAPYNLYEILFEIQRKGYQPILAHPERYKYYHLNFEEYQKLIDAGCLFQLNLLSLAKEQYGKPVYETALKLLKENKYTFVGSDTHHNRHLNLMEKIATKKNKILLEPLFKNNIDVFSF